MEASVPSYRHSSNPDWTVFTRFSRSQPWHYSRRDPGRKRPGNVRRGGRVPAVSATCPLYLRSERYRKDYMSMNYEWHRSLYWEAGKKHSRFKRNGEKEYEDLKIGERIKQLRLESGMTQEELAKRLHTTKSAISRLENHAESMRLATIEKLKSDRQFCF